MRRRLPFLAMVLLLLPLGCARIELDVDIFNLLPRDSPIVEGLRLYQRSFGSSRELLISLRGQDAATTQAAAESLATALATSELSPRVIWRSPFRDDPADLGELLAYLWLNQPPEEFQRMAQRFDGAELAATLAYSLERMATSFRPDELARLGRDPFGLTDLGSEVELPLAKGMADPFASTDGAFRILFVAAPEDALGFGPTRSWVNQVEERLARWQAQQDPSRAIQLRVTGNPAFVVELGSGLLRDVQLAALGTLLLVAALFWWVHRRWAPLLWLMGLLIFVLAVTAVLGGALFGRINAVSLGFAAILLGLATDYGLILYQEVMAHPDRKISEHRSAVAPSILWAAATTASAFFMIGRSSLPGLTQLGVLVGIGILVAAAVMLTAFLPPLVRNAATLHTAGGRVPAAFKMKARTGWWVSAVLILLASGMLAAKRPAVDYDTQKLGPRDARARAALAEVEREIGGFDDSLWLILSGATESEVGEGLRAARPLLEEAERAGLLADVRLPHAFWPEPKAQASNRTRARRLASQWTTAEAAAVEMGFSESSLALSRGIFAAWERLASGEGTVWPTRPHVRWMFQQFAAREEGRAVALGRLAPAADAPRAALLELAAEVEASSGAQLVGWGLLAESLLGVMDRDLRRTLIPMAAVLLLFLALAFRKPGEVLLSLGAMGISLLCLLALMALLGWSWNLMNVMALPMLLGAGVDYSLHIQLGLRRYGGDATQVRNTVGRAILLCAASTAAGFGTLGFAANAGIASLGRVCAAGVIIASLVSVFLLPIWWRALPGRARDLETLETT